MKKLKLWSGLLILFLSGVLVGGGATWIYWQCKMLGFLGGHERIAQKLIVRKLDHELLLTVAQKAQIEKIVHHTFGKLGELQKRYRPEREQIFDQGAASIRAVLSTGQQKKFDILLTKIKRLRSHRETKREKTP
jgi:hypothetical protein